MCLSKPSIISSCSLGKLTATEQNRQTVDKGITQRFASALKAGVVYFALVFGAGFILGPLRILLVVPRVGERVAELIEAPLMLGVIFFSARFVVRKFRISVGVGNRLVVGLLALTLGLVFEFTLVMKLRGLTLSQYFQMRDPIAAAVYYLMLGFCAVMPSLVARNPYGSDRNDR